MFNLKNLPSILSMCLVIDNASTLIFAIIFAKSESL